MISVLHILPALNIGGVEVAVQKSFEALSKRYSYKLFSIKGAGVVKVQTATWNEVLSRLIYLENCPDVVVTSLWPSHPLGYAFHQRGAVWIPFFHTAHRGGWYRDIVLKWAVQSSNIQLCDSSVTAEYHGLSGPGLFICPYRFKSECMILPDGYRNYRYAYCGRMSAEKRPDLLLDFISVAQAEDPDASFLLIIAGDTSASNMFKRELHNRGLNATLVCNVCPAEVPRLLQQSVFYLSLSDYEGFSMTTVDAIQAGCVPVVRPVGEITRYVDKASGVFVTDVSRNGMQEVTRYCKILVNCPDERAARVTRIRKCLDAYDDYVSAFSSAIDYAMAHK